MVKPAMWSLVALYAGTLAVLLWLRQGNLINLLIGTVMGTQTAWWLWGHRLRGGPPSKGRGLSKFVLACAAVSLLLTCFAAWAA